MTLFDETGRLRTYESAEQIIEDFFPIRAQLYVKRKRHQLDVLSKQLRRLDNKTRFICEVIDEIIVLRNARKDDIVETLRERDYDELPAKDG